MTEYQKVKFVQIRAINNSSPVIVYISLSTFDQISLEKTIQNFQSWIFSNYF